MKVQWKFPLEATFLGYISISLLFSDRNYKRYEGVGGDFNDPCESFVDIWNLYAFCITMY